MKPENLIYDSHEANALLKVIDFGTAQQYNSNEKF